MGGEGHEGGVIACERCGGSLPLRDLAEQVFCPYCGHPQRIDPARLAALRGYRDEAARDFEEAASHRVEAQVFRARQRQIQRSSAWSLVIIAPMMIGTLLAFAVVPIGHGAGLYDWNTASEGFKTSVYAGIAIFSLSVGVLIAFVIVLVERRHARTEARAPREDRTAAAAVMHVAGTVLCPRCGGPNEVHAGVPTEECTFCHATFAPDEAVRAAGLDASEGARREAALARYRQERMTVAGLMSQSGATAKPEDRSPAHVALSTVAVVGGLIAPIACIGSCFGFVQNVTGAEEHSWAGVLAGGAFSVLLLAAAGTAAYKARELARRLRAEARDRLPRYGGEPVPGLVTTAHWLSTCWAGPYELELLVPGESYTGAKGELAGYPWLFELAEGGRAPRAQVLAAGFFPQTPDVSRAPEDVRRIVGELEAAGARVVVGEAGARARFDPGAATPERVNAIRDRLVLLVARLGGRPVAAA